MKLAFIGTGRIIGDALYASAPVEAVENTAVFGRPHSREKAEALAEKYGIGEVWTDYAELLEKTAADTVYIGLINSAHYSYAKEALLNGKNVILEKPLTCFAHEAEELQRIAREKKLCIVEAVTVLHGPMIVKMQENLKKLGTVRMFLANFSQYSSRYDSYLRGTYEPTFSPENCGGALYDLNVYNIHYCVGLFGAPKSARYYPNTGCNGVDTSGTLVMEYDGFKAVCTGAKDSDSPGFVCVQGEQGYMRLDGKPNVASSLVTVITDGNADGSARDAAGAVIRSSVTEKYDAPECFHRMTREFEEFADIIDRKDLDAADMWMSESVTVMKILEEARLSAGLIK